MKRASGRKIIPTGLLLALIAAVLYIVWVKVVGGGDPVGYWAYSITSQFKKTPVSGSLSCEHCHKKFYLKWSTSWHGLALQPFTARFAQTQLSRQKDDIIIGTARYRMEFAGEKGWVAETDSTGTKTYQIAQVMGGKNVYYFLTRLDNGRLQVVPTGYDTRKKIWFDVPLSSLRHHTGAEETLINWKDREYTFNTSCYSCHVSQLTNNYNAETDQYHTAWAEPGINCETCHGNGTAHIKACILAGWRRPPADMKIISTSKFTPDQTNSLCAPCHAKMMPITTSFTPGERFFDHYDITTLEDIDFYPDGRELGEDFTYTTWLTSPCLKGGKLDCMHCHTSSGRYRFKGDSVNFACMPCHQKNVSSIHRHAHHADTNKAIKCVACHMPMTEFARMRRSDHSLRPPTPATTIAFGSPNACMLCHTTRTAQWADSCVRQWHKEDYQAPYLYRGALIEAARNRNWTRLPEMLGYILDTSHNEIFANSLVRLLMNCADERKWPALIRALSDRSPLIRSSAAVALSGRFTPQAVEALCGALHDEYRIVRIRAASALAGIQPSLIPDEGTKYALRTAENELMASLSSRLDNDASNNNLGNFFHSKNHVDSAIKYFERAIKLRPDHFSSWANAALAYNAKGNTVTTETYLRKALSLDSSNADIHFNLALFLGERQRLPEAAEELRISLRIDPTQAVAAYNLAIIEDNLGNPGEAIRWSQKAASLTPQEPKYGYTHAYYLWKNGQSRRAIGILEKLLQVSPDYVPALRLCGDLYRQAGNRAKAIASEKRANGIEGKTDK